MKGNNYLSMLLLLGLPFQVLAQQDAATLFAPIYEVLTHPRCLNCHTVTEFPRQGGALQPGDQRFRRRHDQLVVRGADGHGAPTLQCGACHHDANFESGLVPGAPHWHLAPLSMGWEDADGGPLPAGEICQKLLDRSKNGNRSPEDLFKHMTEDALVLWAWEPGGTRMPPDLSTNDFRQALRAWLDAAGSNSVPPCPAP